MFIGAKELVEAQTRYSDAEDDGSEHDPNDALLHRSYLQLVRYIPMVATLQNQIDPLEGLLYNVSD